MKMDKEMQKEIAKSKAVNEKEGELVDGQTDDAPQKKADGKLVLAEEIVEGHISMNARTYRFYNKKFNADIYQVKLYFTSMGGPLFWFIFVGGMLFTEFTLVIQTWFLGLWASEYQEHDPSEVSVP